MSPLRPQLLLTILAETPLPQPPRRASQNSPRFWRDQLLPVTAVLTAFGLSVAQNTAMAQVATPTQINFGSGPNATDFPVGSALDDDFEAQGVGPSGPTGVNLRFRLNTNGTNQANRPIPGNELIGNFPLNPPAGPPPNLSPVAADDVAGVQNPNTPLTGGLPIERGNILLGIDSIDLTGFQTFSVELFNAAGDPVPANNITYTIIDLDRSCNREDGDNGIVGTILWQDVMSTRVLQTPTGDSFGPTVIDDATLNTPGASGTPGGPSETVQNITGQVGAGYTPAPNSLTFRGITDPTAATDPILTAETGNTNCNDPLFDTANLNPNLANGPLNDPDALTGSGGFPGDNDDNRNVEASNNIGQPPFQEEGNVELSAVGRLADRVEFQFGNGVQSGAQNGLGEDLRLDPDAHGVGVLGEFSFEPAIIGISETSNNPIFQPTGDFAGQFIVKYSLLVENVGDVDLTNVNVTNNLNETFGQGNYTVVPGSLTINDVVQPDGFNGDTNQTIPIPGTLEADGQRIVMFEVAFDANAATAAVGRNFYENQSTVTANPIDPQTGAASTVYTVRDRSSNADTVETLDVDADTDDPDDGDPANLGLPGSFPNPFNPEDPNFGTIDRVAGDNDPTNNDSPTIVRVIPQIGVTKQVTDTTENDDGTFTVSYRQIVCNLGGEDLNGLSLAERLTLDEVFRVGQANGVTSAELVPGSVVSPATAPEGITGAYQPLTVNAGFDGRGNLQLTSGDALEVGECGVVDYQVVVNPTDPVDPTVRNLGDGALGNPANDDPTYDAQVEATAVGAASQTQVRDLSDDVTDLEPAAQLPGDSDGDGLATNPLETPTNPQTPIPGSPDNDPTPVSFAATPEIGLTKQIINVTPPQTAPDGRTFYDVTFRYRVCNTGDLPLNGLVISDNYDEQFTANGTGPVADYEVISVTPGESEAAGPLAADAGATGQTTGSGVITLASGGALVFDPNTNPEAVDGCTGDSAILQTVVRVFEPDLTATYQSNASVTALPVGGSTPVTDLSDDVPQFGEADPDNGLGTPGPGANPTDPSVPENTPTPIVFAVPEPLQLFKRITSITSNGVTTTFPNVDGVVPDPSFVGRENARDPNNLLFEGDEVEYTIYYFNSSDQALTNVEVCDPLPEPLSVVPGSLTATPQGSGVFVSPLTPLPSSDEFGRSCEDNSAGERGAAVFDVGTVAPQSGGSVTFRARVQP